MKKIFIHIPIVVIASIPLISLTNSILSIDEENKNNQKITQIQSDSIQLFNTPFLGTILGQVEVEALGWNAKQSITLDDWKTMAPNVVHIAENTFKSNLIIEEIIIPNSITTMDMGVFSDSSLKVITFQDESKLTSIENATFKNSKIESIIVPPSVTSINGSQVFSNTPNLTKIKMNHDLIFLDGTHRWGLTQLQWNLIEFVFDPFLGTELDNNEVRNIGFDTKAIITLEDWNIMAPNVTIIGSAFENNEILTRIDIPKTIFAIEQEAFKNTTNLKIIKFEADSVLSRIGAWSFQNSGLATIDLPSSLLEINKAAFSNMLSLASITIPPNIKKLSDQLFSGSVNLENLILPSGLKEIGSNVFNGTTKLTEIVVPLTVETISSTAFVSSNFTNIIMPRIFLGDNSLKYGWTQAQWNLIEWVYAPFWGTEFNNSILALIGWEEKTIITLADWRAMAPNIETINAGFANNETLKSIEIPNYIFNFQTNSFKNTKSLEKVVFEKNSQLRIIEEDVFFGSSLKSIKIPDSVIFMDENSFRNTILNNIKMPLKFQDYLVHFGLSDEQWNKISWINAGFSTGFVILMSSLSAFILLQGIVMIFIIKGIRKLD